jgi:hypothetical protein
MSYGDPSGSPNPFTNPPNPYQTPSSAPGYMPPPPTPGADVPMILGIISIILGVVAVPLSCCACFGLPAGALAAILGVVALVMPTQPGSPGKMLGIGGIVLGLVPFVFFVVMLIVSALNPQPAFNNNNDPFNFNVPAVPDEGEK